MMAVAVGAQGLGGPRPQHQVRAGPSRADQGEPRLTILRIEAPRCGLINLAGEHPAGARDTPALLAQAGQLQPLRPRRREDEFILADGDVNRPIR